MWWCWGKSNKDAPGCRYGKHESREDELDDQEMENPENKMKNIRCLWCKEKGHTDTDWPKDPNYKYGADIQLEFKRVMKIGWGYGQSKSDPLNHTTKFIKALVKNRELSNPFSVGWLEFDDYNYDYVNSLVLISQK